MYKVLHLPLQLPVGNHSKQEVSWQWGVRRENTTWENTLNCLVFNFVILFFLINKLVEKTEITISLKESELLYKLKFGNWKVPSSLGHNNGRTKPERWRETSVPSWSFFISFVFRLSAKFYQQTLFYAISYVVLHLSDSQWTELASFPSSSTAYVDSPQQFPGEQTQKVSKGVETEALS